MKRKLSILISSFLLALSSCTGFLPSIVPSNSQSTDLVNSYTNTNGENKYAALDKTSINAIPGQVYQLHFTTYKQGETPNYSSIYKDITWGSENADVATIDENGIVTTIGVGTTRVYAIIFKGIGAYCTINVVEKELDSIAIKNARKTYTIGSEFSPVLTLEAIFKGGFRETVVPTSIDYSSVDTSKVGTYLVNVSYTSKGVNKSTSYEVRVIENPTYEARYLDYDSNDLYEERTYGWYNPKDGNVKGLVIPVYFTDSNTWINDSEKEKIRTDLNKAFFGEQEENGWNSVKSYYYNVSNHKLNLSGSVSQWHYTSYKASSFTGKDVDNLVKECVEWYFDNHPEEDMKTYDSDHNGVFDYLNIIYGCPDANADKNSLDRTFWGKISAKSAPIVKGEGGNPDIKFHMWASYQSLYEDEINHDVDSHVFIHETGHTFGLVDYYDYAGLYRPIGGSTMMMHNTHQQDPFSTLVLGWSKVIVPETSAVIELSDYQSSYTSLLLSANPETVNSPFDEYILLELYTPTGVNRFDTEHEWKGYYTTGPLTPGIRIWHVDARIYEINNGEKVITDNVMTDNYSKLACTNSWGDGHESDLGEDYIDYSLLFDVRNDKSISYKPTTEDENVMTSDATLFHAGDTFTLDEYSSQFVSGNKLNNGKEFPWKITIESIQDENGSYKAVINLENTL